MDIGCGTRYFVQSLRKSGIAAPSIAKNLMVFRAVGRV
jgi:hypothetical protein